jgi:hypothetical protein
VATCWQRGRQRPHFVHKLHSISPAKRFCVYLYVCALSEISVTTVNKGGGTSWKTGELQKWEMFPRLTTHNPYPPTVSPPNVLNFVSTSEPWALFLVSLLHLWARIAQSLCWLGHRLDDEENVRWTVQVIECSVLQKVQTGSGALPVGTGGCFPGGKTAGTWTWPLISI